MGFDRVGEPLGVTAVTAAEAVERAVARTHPKRRRTAKRADAAQLAVPTGPQRNVPAHEFRDALRAKRLGSRQGGPYHDWTLTSSTDILSGAAPTVPAITCGCWAVTCSSELRPDDLDEVVGPSGAHPRA